MKFEEGIHYPWIRPKGLTNIFWALIPIFGWIAVMGYMVDIITSVVSGNSKQGYPVFRGFWTTFVEGLMFLLRLIPITLVLLLALFLVSVLSLGLLSIIFFFAVTLFYAPMMSINLMVKKKVSATFEFEHIFGLVFKNFGNYIVVLLKTLGYMFVTGLLSFVLVGIPMRMSINVYYADFYRENGGNK
ncbi:MAG: DUF4013 domain-containing protein [Candidatus Nanoarchaeia archaeon]|jgi:hypothetical protein|nr:DUF4013 domain-containing protein [Candidatus Nanoarchaeia archaeon]|tara:strand:+ start:976 stop:1536 length:561 start_codon:yes stop_codon:yes gene_type:complete